MVMDIRHVFVATYVTIIRLDVMLNVHLIQLKLTSLKS